MYSDIDLRLLFESVLETAVDGIINIDSKGIVIGINKAAQDLFEFSKEEVIGQNVKILMNSHDASNHDAYISRYLSTKQAKIIGIGREVIGKSKSGELFPFRLAVSEVILNDRILFTGIIHDLRDVKKAYKELEDLNNDLDRKVKERTYEVEKAINQLLITNKQLQKEIKERTETARALKETEEELKLALMAEKELNELKSKFVTTASHEFRTPLTTILSSASIILKYPSAEEQQNREKHVEKIKIAVNHLTGLLNDFLSLSKLEEGKVNTKFENFQLKNIFSEIRNELSGILQSEQEILFDFSEEMEINCDKSIFKNIFFNLISNAVKYSNESVSIDVEENTEHFLIRIIDKGVGIPEADQKFLFERFFRATNVGNVQGTGLGLNIVKRYCELIMASISFVSIYNQGTTFEVKIPKNHKAETNTV